MIEYIAMIMISGSLIYIFYIGLATIIKGVCKIYHWIWED